MDFVKKRPDLKMYGQETSEPQADIVVGVLKRGLCGVSQE
jgi:hypothetical protein